MDIRPFLSVAILLFTMLSACQRVEDESLITLSDASPASLALSGAANDTMVINFSSSGAWEVQSSAPSWLSCLPVSGSSGNGSFRVMASENNDGSVRDGTLTIRSGSALQTINVSQKERGSIFFTPDSAAVPIKGGDITVAVLSNMGYSAVVEDDSKDWITAVSTKAVTESVLTLSVAPNCTYCRRTGRVHITTDDGVTGIFTVQQASKKADVFDEEAIVASIGAVSDTHISGRTTDSGDKFSEALRQLKARAAESDGDGLDAVMVVGDLINNGYSGQYWQIDDFKAIYESVLSPSEVPMIYTVGNHDAGWNASIVQNAKIFRTKLGDAYYAADIDKEMGEGYECRHCVVKGVHILSVSPTHSAPVTYDYKVLSWLDTQLETLTSADPDSYVLIITHPMVQNTVYGSTLVSAGRLSTDASVASMWYTAQLTSVLRKYPQVVIFGGHLHFPINEPRSIWQGDFTALGCGSVWYMAFEGGDTYAFKASGTTLSDRYEFSQGYLLQIDVNGNMRIRKLDFYRNAVFENDWMLSRPDASGTNLNAYSSSARALRNLAPSLSTLEVEKSDVQLSVVPVCAKWAAAEDDEFAHHYELVLNDGSTTTTVRIMADYYLHDRAADMKKEWSYDIGPLAAGTYSLSLTAVDSWGACSNTLTETFTVEADPSGGDDPSATLPSAYVDFSFDGGTIKDINGKVSVTNHGAAATTATVSFGGNTCQKAVLSVTSGDYAMCQFNELDSPALMKCFAAGGFSVEAFYVEQKSTSAVQAIVCGTETGGWGLAERASGVPYFIVGEGASSCTYAAADSPVASSRTTLNHIVGVYDPASAKMYIYLNGVMRSYKSISGVYFPGSGDAFNRFCLGADIKAGDQATDFKSADALIVDAKIYTCALNASQVKLAYEAAIGAL